MIQKLLRKLILREPAIAGVSGRYRFTVTDSKTGKVKRQSVWHKNLVMNGTNTGVQLIAQNLILDAPAQLKIDSASIGTGTTAPSAGDSDLETPVTTGIIIRTKAQLGNVAQADFFITDAELPDGTYNEFGIFANGNIIARSLITPAFTKASGEDVTITYEITIAPV
jgi:hypothetical protein